jgi:hypothetical protein
MVGLLRVHFRPIGIGSNFCKQTGSAIGGEQDGATAYLTQTLRADELLGCRDRALAV